MSAVANALKTLSEAAHGKYDIPVSIRWAAGRVESSPAAREALRDALDDGELDGVVFQAVSTLDRAGVLAF